MAMPWPWKVGEKIWEFKTRHEVLSSPAIGSNGTIYVGSRDYKVYAIQGSSGPATDAPWPMFGQNAQRTGRASSTQTDTSETTSETTTITLPSWSWLETYPWVYNAGTWYYMKPIGSQDYLYNYTTQEWKLMGE